MRLRGTVWTGLVLKGREAPECKNNASYSHSHSKARVKVVFLNSLSDLAYIFPIKLFTRFYIYNDVLSYKIFVLSTGKILTEN